MDLVGPGPLDPHFEDAVAAVGWLEATGEWADLGSGAGFPGSALAALNPDARILLVERRQKRCAFLEALVTAAPLPNARVVCGDAEALPAASLDGVVSRAFRPPAALLPLAARLLRPGGTLLLLLAREQVEPPAGWTRFHVEPYAAGDRSRRAEGWRLEPSFPRSP
jgi:16S rRNA (guanine527-N7)-methyltransferase